MIDPAYLSSFAGIGFVLGFRHAFEPDHLAAVSTLATRPGGLRGALWLGTAWGVGHTVSFGVALLLLLLLDLRLPAAVHSAAELGVALLLVALGASTWRAELGRPGSAPAAADAESAGSEERSASPEPLPEERGAEGGRRTGQSFGFGLIHGLAGSGTLMVLLAATAASEAEQLAYFVPFGAGTVGGMLVVSVATFGFTAAASRRRVGRVRERDPGGDPDSGARRVRLAAAAMSIAIGCWLALETVGWIG